jgi:hypothetical protein
MQMTLQGSPGDGGDTASGARKAISLIAFLLDFQRSWSPSSLLLLDPPLYIALTPISLMSLPSIPITQPRFFLTILHTAYVLVQR